MSQASGNDVVGVGIAGCGRMASIMMAAFSRLPGVKVLAAFSSDPVRAREFADRHGIRDAMSHLEDMLARPEINAVYVANSNVQHAPTSIQALRAGKAVLCEKPFAVTLLEGQSVISTAEETGQVFMEAMWTSHLPAYRRLADLVRSGAIGEAIHLHADFGYPTAPSSDSGLYEPGPGGGVLLDRGVYPISLAIQLFGRAEHVQAMVRRDLNGVDVHASIQLLHTEGRQSQLACSFEGLSGNCAVVTGTRGQAKLLSPLVGSQAVSIRKMQPLRIGRGPQAEPRLSSKLKQALLQLGPVLRLRSILDGRTEVLTYGSSPYLPMLRQFLEFVRSRNESLALQQQMSLEVLSVIDRARTARHGH